MRHAFGPFELDTARYRLRKNNESIALDRKAFDTLHLLIEFRERVVKKEEILERVWADTAVVEGVVPAAIRRIRIALGQEHGRQEPIETVHGRGYRFAAEVREIDDSSAQNPRPTLPPGLHAEPDPEPFVGRQELLQRLLDAHGSARAGHGRLTILAGESGVGKTRIADQCGRTALSFGTRVWFARCYEDAGAPALWPFLRIIRSAMADLPDSVLGSLSPSIRSDLASLIPEIAATPSHQEGSPEDPRAARYRLYDSITSFLIAATAVAPCLAIIDDLQWADPASLQVLDFLAARIADLPLFVVCTVREDELPTDSRTRATLERIARQHGCERIVVPRLTRTDIEGYLTVAGVTPAEASIDWVFETTGGNAFALREVVRALRTAPEGLQAAVESAPTKPEAARDLVRRLVERLSPATVSALRIAAVFGSPFRVATLGRALGGEPGPARSAMEEAETAGVVRHASSTRWELSHDLVRDTLYEGLSAVERARAHLATALALEEEGAAASEIASHFHRGLPHRYAGRLMEHARRAATAAGRVHAYDEAARFYRVAIDATGAQGAGDAGEKAELWLSLARALVSAGRFSEAEEAAERVRELAQKSGSVILLAEAALVLRPIGRLWQASDPKSRAALEEALAALPTVEGSLRPRILASLSMTLPLTISESVRRSLVDEALRIAPASADPATVVAVQTARLNALLGPDHCGALVEASSDVIRLAGERGLGDLALAARALLALAHLTSCDVPLAAREYDEIGRLSNELRNPLTRWRADIAKAAIALGSGRFEEAEAEFRAAYQAGRRFTGARAELVLRAQMQELDSLRGKRPDLGALDPDLFTHRFAWAGASVSAYLAEFLLAGGDKAGAARVFDRVAEARFENISRSIGYLSTLRAAALVAVGLEDRARGEILVERLAPYAHLNAVAEFVLYYGPVAYYVGKLEVLLGRASAAADHFEQALRIAEGSGMRPMAARAGRSLGELLLGQGGAPAKRGEALIREARAAAASMGMQDY